MDIRALQRNWDALGRADPLWAIRFDPSKKGNRWDVEEFFRTGEGEVAALLASLRQLSDRRGVATPARTGRALDFGCGVGRLTQALAGHFDQVDGVDIAPSMIELAERYNRHGPRCRYHLNERDDLQTFGAGSFDLVYSTLVLQHVEGRYVRRYLAEFLRVLRPGGVAVFDLPSHPSRTLQGRLFRLLPQAALNAYRRLRYGYPGVMEQHGIRRPEVEELLRADGGTVLEVADHPTLGAAWHCYRYFVTVGMPVPGC
jgi:SAM-dependent methyltransferase